jgi:UDP-N-acetylglucosamine--N-acetylmuramyl-(pentapeptide) pyrophosphoryl-undecaprenol N-acetylglucosamine transferase
MCEHNFTRSLVVTGGGTGGHYFPAIAIAEGVRARWCDRPIVFVGSKRGIEGRLLVHSDWPYLLLDVEGFVGRSPLNILKSGLKLAFAYSQLKAIWTHNRPWAVVGTGGYGSAPALLAARSLGVPFFIHESNAKPGLLVKYLSSSAYGVWCGMEAVRPHLSGARHILTGTPVRSTFLRKFSPIQLNKSDSKFQLLVLGGSGGASVLNGAMLTIAPLLLDRFPSLHILHQVGEREFSKITRLVTNARHSIVPFLSNIDLEMEAATLVITRSGASTCAELMTCGRPALMVPMPNSAGNHQVMNARAMVDDGRAVMLHQTDNLSVDLLNKISMFVANPELLLSMSLSTDNHSVAACLENLQTLLD